MLADAAEGDDHRQADGQRADGQRRPAPVAQDRGAGEALLESSTRRERRAGDAGQGRQHERDAQGGDQQHGVHGERPDERRLAADRRPDEQADDADDGEDGDEPAQAGAAGRRQVEPGLERLDRRDPTGAAGRLEGRGEGHREADRDGGDRAVERDDTAR